MTDRTFSFQSVGNTKYTTGIEVRVIEGGQLKNGFRRFRCGIDDNAEVIWVPDGPLVNRWNHQSYGAEIDAEMLRLVLDRATTHQADWFWHVDSAAGMEIDCLRAKGVESGDRYEMLRRVRKAFQRWAGQSKRKHSPLEFYENAVRGGEPLPPEPDFNGVW